MKTIITIVFLLFCNTLYAETARDLNTRGYRLYKQHKYEQALILFKKATVVNPRYYLAFYNAASTLGVLHKKSVCRYDAYKSEINKYLKKAIQLHPQKVNKMKLDSDLNPVHDTFVYQRLLGLKLNRSSHVRKILRRVSWYGSAEGAFGPISHIYFKPEGKVLLQKSYFDESSNLKSSYEKARYKVRGRLITIYRKAKSGKTIISYGNLDYNGVIHFDDNMPEAMRRFTDDADNCSA